MEYRDVVLTIIATAVICEMVFPSALSQRLRGEKKRFWRIKARVFKDKRRDA